MDRSRVLRAPEAWRQTSDRKLDRLGERALAAAVVVASVVALASVFNYYALDDRVAALNAETEASLNNWLTVTATFACGLAAGLHP